MHEKAIESNFTAEPWRRCRLEFDMEIDERIFILTFADFGKTNFREQIEAAARIVVGHKLTILPIKPTLAI